MRDFILGVLGNLMAAEIGAWCRGLAQKIVCATARKLPEEYRSRMLEEWSALLEDLPGDLSKLWMAISLYRKRSELTDECESLRDESLLHPVGIVLRLTKRFIDIVVSASGLLLMLPVLLLVALLIKIDSPGPVFCRQVRVGFRGRPFSILRFRTMVQDAARAGTRWAQRDDPQISRIGRLLRRVSFETIPEYINVLKGEMSVVGPRPEPPVFVQYMQETIPEYSLRHMVKPGMTGWAQVRFLHGTSAKDSSMRFQCDLYYVKRLSLLLDLKIMAESVRVMSMPPNQHGT